MIKVQLNRQNFEYDVHSLVKAFYPDQDVQIVYTPEAFQEASEHQKGTEHIRKEAIQERNGNGKKEAPQEEVQPSLLLVISYIGEQDQKLLVQFLEKEAVVMEDEICMDADLERKEVKNQLKRLLYRMLSAYTGQSLPWGNLTGIRPTKIPMTLLEQGWKNSEIAQYMRETYYTSKEKTALAISIANKERHLLKEFHNNMVWEDCPDAKKKVPKGYSLYVGIPFCPSICLYCSFSSSPLHLWKDQVDAYLDALCKEIEYAADACSGMILETVYIGGGTPTTLEPYQMDRLLTKLEQSFDQSHVKEFTVEAGRPDSITREKLEVLRRHGISRISINPQTMNQKTLDLIGRKHTVEDTIQIFQMARKLGFDNINMDLIVGLPGEGKEEVEHTMQEIAKLDPENVTVHSLAVKRAARLKLFKEEHKEMTMTNNSEIMDMTAAYAQKSELYPYYMYRQKNMAGNFENVGYAKEGKEGLYNILIMEEVQSILALGAGASTKLVWAKDRIERIENVKDIRNYIDRIDEMIERKRAGLYEYSHA